MSYVMIVHFQTSKHDEMRNVIKEWEAAKDVDDHAAERVVMCKDRDNPGRYFNIVFCRSYEEYQDHAELPKTTEFGQRLFSLADGPPTFLHLDIVEDRI